MKYLTYLFTLLALMWSNSVFAYDIAVKNSDGVTIYYNYINDGKELEVTFGENPNANLYYVYRYSGNVVIPEEVTYMNRVRKVTSIGSCAFLDCPVNYISIPRSISNIGGRAFEGCAISSFVIPDETIAIGDDAFRNCSLTSISIGKGLSYISKEAFYGSGLTSVVIPDNIKVLKSYAFYGCTNLLSITIGSGLDKIEAYVFGDCINLEKVIIKDLKKWCNITLDSYYNSYHREYQYHYTNPLSVCKHLFSDEDTEITELVIPEGVGTINSNTFYACENITSVSLPSSLTVIGESAFRDCGITSLVIGDNVEDIQQLAFNGCPLNTIIIPNNVNSIGVGAFGGNISSVYSYIKEPFSISSSTFNQNTFYNATLYVPTGTIEKYKSTEGWKDFLFIEDYAGGSVTPRTQKCVTPIIKIENNKLIFSCETEGVQYHYDITHSDVKSGEGNNIELSNTYTIKVYATKDQYEKSDVATMEIKGSVVIGDTNSDGTVNAADIVNIVNIIMGN